jgi:hypothetical protein
MKTVTTEELENLKELSLKFNEAKVSIADAELAKHKFFRDLDALSNDYKELETVLLEKYGNVNINLQTGEINDQD